MLITRSNVNTIVSHELECHMMDAKSNGLAVKSYLEPLGVTVTLYNSLETFLKVNKKNFLR